MAQRITILEYANIKGLTVYDVTQNAKEKGVILPEDPEYVLDDRVSSSMFSFLIWI